jgi:SAM-dependent methyltransferase
MICYPYRNEFGSKATMELCAESSLMKSAWNARAATNACFYIETTHSQGDIEGFFALGEQRARLLIDPVLRDYGIDPREKSALDFGCGLGRFTRTLASRFATCTGVDVADEMVARATELHRGQAGNATFLASDGVSLPLPDASVDFVFSYEVFQHFPSRAVSEQGLAHVARVLRPDGLAVIHFKTRHESGSVAQTIYRRAPDWMKGLIDRLRRRDDLMSDAAFRGTLLRTDAIRDMSAQAGLDVLAFRDDPTHEAGTRTFAVLRPAGKS